jgi:nicotinate phosphoribosyltransferase
MSFPNEEEAFNAYAELYPDSAVFLIDTYDTLKSGVVSAINAGKKLQERGKSFGVRLDSGDIQYLSIEVRRMLDNAGLNRATITVSSELDESIIETLVNAGAPVDTWGVGARMVTGAADSALSGIYKMAACEDADGRMAPVMKFSDNPEKTTNPGVKQVWRIRDSKGTALADVLALDDDDVEAMRPGDRSRFWHPAADYRHFFHILEAAPQTLLKPRFAGGELHGPQPSLDEIRSYSAADIEAFDITYKRLLNPHGYKVSITEKLRSLKLDLLQHFIGDL